MIEISKEEFVKRLTTHPTYGLKVDFDVINEVGIVLLDREGWEKVKKLICSLDTSIPSRGVPIGEIQKEFENRRAKILELRKVLEG